MSDIKKITQKTLIFLLAILMLTAATGAGIVAAAPSAGGALFYYENISGSTGTYKYLNNIIALDNIEVLKAVDMYPEGTYSNTSGVDSFLLTKLKAQVTIEVLDENNESISMDGNIPQGSKVLFEITTNSPYLGGVGLKFTNPKGTLNGTSYLGTQDFSANSFGSSTRKIVKLDNNLMEGTWKVWAYFNTSNAPGFIVPSAPYEYKNGQTYQFTIAPSSSVSMTVDTTEATVGNYIQISVSGKAGDTYLLKENEKYSIVPGYEYIQNHAVTIGSNGETTFNIQAVKDGTFTLQLCNATTGEVEQDAELTFRKATITATAKESSATIGDDITLTGTNEKGDTLYYYLEGVNQVFTQIPSSYLKYDRTGEDWETTIRGSYISSLNLDTGIYTFYVSTSNGTIKDNVLNRSGSSASVGIELLSPALMLTSAPDVVVQGNDLVVKGIAEGNPANVTWYLFGTNLFCFNTTDVGKSGSFIIEKTLDKDTFAAGQYYLVVQHPMYNKLYSVGAIKSGNSYQIVQNKSGSYDVAPYDLLFTVNDRQSANAAYALGEAINSEDIDDIAVKRSFIITASATTVDPIPSEISKGLPFTVSGTTNNENSETISVELLSTAFTVASKNQATSASYITLIAKPDENGKWAVTFDTSGLNVDLYTVNVLVGTAQAASEKIKIVEPSTPTVTPTTQQTTALPTAATAKPTEAPKSPLPLIGILAGLAVAVLYRKRNEP